MNLLGSSWRTSVAAWGVLATTVGNALNAAFDSDPATNPDWVLVITAALAAFGFISARDNRVTSEQAGAK